MLFYGIIVLLHIIGAVCGLESFICTTLFEQAKQRQLNKQNLFTVLIMELIS